MRLKAGDIFEVYLSNNKKQFFQFVFKNMNELGGEMIRAFDLEVNKEEIIDVKTIISHPIKFYTHTMVGFGVKQSYWNRVGNVPIETDFVEPTFRGTDDVYSAVKKSNRWYLKTAGKVTQIGELKEEYKTLPKVGITPCHAVIKQLETGWDGFMVPE